MFSNEEGDAPGNLETGAGTGTRDPGTGSGTRPHTGTGAGINTGPRRTRRVTRLDRPTLPKGYAQSLEPLKMSTDISPQELERWLRKWDDLKNASGF